MTSTINLGHLDEGFGGKTYKRKRGIRSLNHHHRERWRRHGNRHRYDSAAGKAFSSSFCGQARILHGKSELRRRDCKKGIGADVEATAYSSGICEAREREGEELRTEKSGRGREGATDREEQRGFEGDGCRKKERELITVREKTDWRFRVLKIPVIQSLKYPNSLWSESSWFRVFHGMDKFGDLEDCIVMKERSTSRSRGFGYVTFATVEDAKNALSIEHFLGNIMLEVKIATPKEEMRAPAKKVTTIFAARILPFVTETAFRSHFERYGDIIDLCMPKDQGSKAHRGIGFITFASAESVDNLMSDTHELGGSTVVVDRATLKNRIKLGLV